MEYYHQIVCFEGIWCWEDYISIPTGNLTLPLLDQFLVFPLAYSGSMAGLYWQCMNIVITWLMISFRPQ